jgi:hypothetical protein
VTCKIQKQNGNRLTIGMAAHDASTPVDMLRMHVLLRARQISQFLYVYCQTEWPQKYTNLSEKASIVAPFCRSESKHGNCASRRVLKRLEK